MSSLVKTSLKNQGTRVAWEPSDGLAVFEDCVTWQNSFRGSQRSPGTTGNQTHSTSQSPWSRVLDYFYPRFHCTHPICSRWTCQWQPIMQTCDRHSSHCETPTSSFGWSWTGPLAPGFRRSIWIMRVKCLAILCKNPFLPKSHSLLLLTHKVFTHLAYLLQSPLNFPYSPNMQSRMVCRQSHPYRPCGEERRL